MTTCSFDGCEKPVCRRDLCRGHYGQLERGTPLRPLRLRRPSGDTQCMVEGCEKPRGMGQHCATHRMRIWRHGDPSKTIQPSERQAPSGQDHPKWRPEAASYMSIHNKLRRERGRAADYFCECGNPATEWSFAGERQPGQRLPFGRPDQYEPSCIPCHRRKDATSRRAVS